MAKLILSNGDTIVDQCWLDDARVTIGRAKGNRIAVNDPSVAETHASISHVGRDYILEDLRGMALNVNGSPMRRRILQHNDVIELGTFHLRFVDSKSSSEIDLERTMLIPGLKFNPDRKPQDLEVTQDLHVPSTHGASAPSRRAACAWSTAVTRRCSTASSRRSGSRDAASSCSRGGPRAST